jgi:hypothetical protein
MGAIITIVTVLSPTVKVAPNKYPPANFSASSLDKAQKNQGSLLKDKSLADPNNLPDPEVLYLL